MKKLFSFIALVGVFAACEPENLQTAFNVDDATLTLKVNVISAAPGFDENAAEVTANWSNGEVTTGLTSTITGKPSIALGSVKVTAKWNGSTSEPVTVTFPQIFAGMDFFLETTVFIPYNSGDYKLVAKPGTPVVTTKVYGLKFAAEGHGYNKAQEVDFNGVKYKVWMVENASEFILEDTYTYATYDGFDVAKDLEILNNDFTAEAQNVFDAAVENAGINKSFESYDFAVGAWSLYNVINPEFKTVTPYTIVAEPLPGSQNPTISAVATFSTYTMSYGIGVVEMSHPDHFSHYVPHSGHLTPDGHYLHGDNNNAGGGIISAE